MIQFSIMTADDDDKNNNHIILFAEYTCDRNHVEPSKRVVGWQWMEISRAEQIQ